jgi:hypothetical protein
VNKLIKYCIFILLVAVCSKTFGQILPEDTATNEPFFKATRFNSKCFVAAEGMGTQILKTQGAMNTGFSLNWVINHRFVISASYYALSTPVNVQHVVEPDSLNANIRLKHQFAGLGFGYIAFDKKLFSFQPQLSAGWGNAQFTNGSITYKSNFGEIIPAVYGIYNATKFFRLGVGLNYRAAIGASLNGLKSADISGISGLVFIRIGTF